MAYTPSKHVIQLSKSDMNESGEYFIKLKI